MRRQAVPAVLAALATTSATAGTLDAQSIFDTSIRTAPQFVSYNIGSPSDTRISELAVPMFVLVPIARWLSLDVGTSYAWAEVRHTGSGATSSSTISGLTDTQVRLNVPIGTDFVVLTAGVNLPTGRATAEPDEQSAATLIGNDFLSFPISNMGTGLGATGGIAIARPLGQWNLGIGASVRRSEAYDPFVEDNGTPIRYQPGDEYRARIGLDHPFGTGNIQFGVTYSRFGDDDIGGSIYNTGDRVLSQAVITNGVGGGDLVISGWNLYRTAGTLADGSASTRENISNLSLSYGGQVSGVRLVPTVEGRSWLQAGKPTSLLGTVGLRIDTNLGPLAVSPGVGFSMGRIATGTDATANVTGLRGSMIVRLR